MAVSPPRPPAPPHTLRFNLESGSFFFYSHDGKYMIKTQSKAESKFLRRILAHYYQHVMTQPNTCVSTHARARARSAAAPPHGPQPPRRTQHAGT